MSNKSHLNQFENKKFKTLKKDQYCSIPSLARFPNFNERIELDSSKHHWDKRCHIVIESTLLVNKEICTVR
jgi:hypothetical protein